MDDEVFNKIYLAIEKNGKHKDYRVSYSMENELDEIALGGRVKVIFDEFYSSDIVINPTYLDICVIANDMLNACDVHDGIYLEDIIFLKKEKDTNVYNLHFGS